MPDKTPSKITELTKEQEDSLIAHREKWLRIGLCTDEIDRVRGEQAIREMYRLIKRPAPRFWYCDSVFQLTCIPALLESLGSNLGANLRPKLWSNLRANLRSNLGANLRAKLEANLWANLGANLRANLWANLEANLGANLRANLWANLRANLRANLNNCFWGQLDSYWIAFYLFPYEYLNIQYSDLDIRKLELWAEIAQSWFWWLPFQDICFVSARPTQIHKNGVRLHNENGPAVEFPDTYVLWYLNGIEVPKELVMTPADKLDCQLALKEPNVDIRREIIRKIGYERLLRELNAKIVDKHNGYELVEFNFGYGDWQYLKMINPSTQAVHVEGIKGKHKTVVSALAMRDQERDYIKPTILT